MKKNAQKNFYLSPANVQNVASQFGNIAEQYDSSSKATNDKRYTNKEVSAYLKEALQYLERAKILSMQDNQSDAIIVLEEATNIFSKNPILWNKLAIQLSYADKHDEALATFDKALECVADNYLIESKVLKAQQTAQNRARRTPDVGNTSGWGNLKSGYRL